MKDSNLLKLIPVINTNPGLKGEKQLIESIIEDLKNENPKLAKHYEKRLKDKCYGNYCGAYFELKLNYFFSKICKLNCKLKSLDNSYDIVIIENERETIVEATAVSEKEKIRKKDNVQCHLRSVFAKYKYPYQIDGKGISECTEIDIADFDKKRSAFLSGNEKRFCYTYRGHTMTFTKTKRRVYYKQYLWYGDQNYRDYKKFRDKIKKKCKNFDASIQKPFVLAFLIDHPRYDIEYVTNALESLKETKDFNKLSALLALQIAYHRPTETLELCPYIWVNSDAKHAIDDVVLHKLNAENICV